MATPMSKAAMSHVSESITTCRVSTSGLITENREGRKEKGNRLKESKRDGGMDGETGQSTHGRFRLLRNCSPPCNVEDKVVGETRHMGDKIGPEHSGDGSQKSRMLILHRHILQHVGEERFRQLTDQAHSSRTCEDDERAKSDNVRIYLVLSPVGTSESLQRQQKEWKNGKGKSPCRQVKGV